MNKSVSPVDEILLDNVQINDRGQTFKKERLTDFHEPSQEEIIAKRKIRKIIAKREENAYIAKYS